MATVSAGKRRQLLLFQQRADADDGYGNVKAGWQDVFETSAELIPQKGGEPVIAARLAGIQPYIIRIPSCDAARQVTTAWRAIDKRDTSRVFNITTVSNNDQKNRMIDIMATQGEAS